MSRSFARPFRTLAVLVAVLLVPGGIAYAHAHDGSAATNDDGPPASMTVRKPTTVSDSWTVPWGISWLPGDGSALVTEREDASVWLLAKDGTRTKVGTVPHTGTARGRGGLFGVAVAPDWDGSTNQDVFFMHTSDDGGVPRNRIVKMSFDGSTLTDRRVLVDDIKVDKYHNGGQIAFGPDGYLYVSTGDGPGGGSAQDKDSLNGKILRMTTSGEPAPGNPFDSLVYSIGHRNVEGLAWDDAGRLWSAEFGEDAHDELNLIQPGHNYGWPICEGRCDADGMTNPSYTWSTAEASPSGIAIVGDTVFMAALRGERLWQIELSGTQVGDVSAHFEGDFGRMRTVSKVPGQDALWISTSNADGLGGAEPGSDLILRSQISIGPRK